MIPTKSAHLVLIDNFDSFTYNLVDQFRALGHPVTVYRNTLPCEEIEKKIASLDQAILVLSPGPGAPADAGCMPELILKLKGKIPIIGICLGQQAITEAYGGKVEKAPEIVHGKPSQMTHSGHPVFSQLENPLTVGRYHSLVATEVPPSLQIIADVDGLIMAVVNERDRVIGFQFHPESILTTQGATLLTNTIHWASQTH